MDVQRETGLLAEQVDEVDVLVRYPTVRAHIRRFSVAVLLVVLAAIAFPHAFAQSGSKGGSITAFGNRDHLAVPLNQSRVIKLRTSAGRVSVANPEVVDIVVLDPQQIYVVGKQLGTTNLVLWDERDQVRETVRIEVTHDLDLLKAKLHQLLPNERIQVRSSQNSIVVSGQVSSPASAEAAVRIAESFIDQSGMGGDRDRPAVLNLLQVGGSQQVMLEVKVAEISRTLSKRLDLNFSGVYDGGSIRIGALGTGALGVGAVPSTGGLAYPDIVLGPALIQDKGLFLSSLSGNFLFNAFIDAAKDQGLAKILAEPNLTTLSGQQARFLAGGEFPIPVPQDNGNTTIEFKEYGVGVEFVPVVLDSGVISMTLNVIVSDLTTATSLSLGTGATGGQTTFAVPALIKRSANSTVEVRSGETIAIAGLISETLRENVNKFPGLGDVPVLGLFFRSQDFVKNQTELVMFVTPRLARSFDPALVRLPTDSFVEPSDLEFYLMGRLEARPPRPAAGGSSGSALGPDKAGSEGVFGHDL